MDQVDGRLFDPGAGRHTGGMPCVVEAGTAMDDYLGTCSPVFPVGDGDLPRGADRYMNGSAGLVDEPVQLGSGVVAQRGTRPAAKDGGPEHGHSRWPPREGGVDAPV